MRGLVTVSSVSVKTNTSRYRFSKMTDGEKRAVVEDLARWDGSVFNAAGDPRGYWLETKSFETILYVLRSESDEVLGYTTIKYFRTEYEEREIYIEKVGIGVIPKQRGNKFALRCILLEWFRWKLRYPQRELYLFSTLIHPVTYKLVCDVFGTQLYPYFEGPQDPAKERLAVYLANYFGLHKADSPHPFVYFEDYSAIETQEAKEYWRTSPRPEVRFFVDHCSGYGDSGGVLITLAPFNFTNAAVRAMRTLGRNRLDRLLGRKHKFKTH